VFLILGIKQSEVVCLFVLWLQPPLPAERVAAGMETGNDKQDVAARDKEQRVRKTAQVGAAHAMEDYRELERVGAHALG
jgi:hypothetical protein